MLNIEGALYFCTFFLGIVNSLIVQPVVAAERTVFYRERAAHMYSVLPYVLSLVRARPFCPICCPWCAPDASRRLLQAAASRGHLPLLSRGCAAFVPS